jgi:hypothetical protein
MSSRDSVKHVSLTIDEQAAEIRGDNFEVSNGEDIQMSTP